MGTLINYSTVRVGYSRIAESNMYIYWINGIEQILWPRSMFAPHIFFSSSFLKKTPFFQMISKFGIGSDSNSMTQFAQYVEV